MELIFICDLLRLNAASSILLVFSIFPPISPLNLAWKPLPCQPSDGEGQYILILVLF